MYPAHPRRKVKGKGAHYDQAPQDPAEEGAAVQWSTETYPVAVDHSRGAGSAARYSYSPSKCPESSL